MDEKGTQAAQSGNKSPSRKKGTGRVFIRGKVWYLRYRYKGAETSRSTKVDIDASTPEKFEESKAQALKVLEKETEILRLREKESRLKIVKMMLEDTQEQIRDRIASIRRDATLSQIISLFESSSRRSNCSEAQMKAYHRYLHTLTSRIGQGIRICDIDEGIADTFATWLWKRPMSEKNSSTMAPNTYNKYINGYEFVWDAIMSKVGITSNPWTLIQRKKLDTSVRKALTDEESESILNVARGETRLLIAIGLYTGLRMGDAVHLRWSDIHDNAVFVTTGKTGSEVAIPLHQRLKEMLDETDEDDDIITYRLAEMYDRNGSSVITRKVKALFEKCGVKTSKKEKGHNARPICGYHSLRSTFVTRCTAAGIPQAVVQALVGHASQKMTQHYTHLQNKDILAAFSSIR